MKFSGKFIQALIVLFLMKPLSGKGQFLMDILDTTSDVGKSVLSVSRKFDNLRISGYIQAQYQVAQEKGVSTYAGGDFTPNASNRFMLRRGRVKFEYAHYPEQKGTSVHFVLQFDGTERGVFIRDFWGSIHENKYKLFSLTAGLFARPFSYELNVSSSERETPERGRMSQILMRTERDMGAMLSFNPREKSHPLRYLKIDAGLFNGQGLTAPAEYDQFKDFISRIYLKSYPLTDKFSISGGASILRGRIARTTKYKWSMSEGANGKIYKVDSSVNNIGRPAPRHYLGADAQLKLKNAKGATELRGEFISGRQTGFRNSSETPASLPTDTSAGYYERKFNGAYFYFLQHLFNDKNQLLIKYDWYDPNKQVKGADIGAAGTNLTAADIRYHTLGFGLIHHFSRYAKFVIYYDRVMNEKTALPGFLKDVRDDVLTLRLQFNF